MQIRDFCIVGCLILSFARVAVGVPNNLVRERHPVSRAALSKLSDLNKSTVSSIVRELLGRNSFMKPATVNLTVAESLSCCS